METGLEGKPWWVAAIIALGMMIALPIIGYKLKFEKMNRQIRRKQTTLQELQQKVNEGRAAKQSLPQFREEVQRLQLELEKLLTILPSQRKTEDLLRRIRTLTEQGDFELKRFTPRSLTPMNDFYSEWPIEIQLEGGYHNLALLFDRISRYRRIINIENLKISPLRESAERPHHTITANFTAKTFLYNAPPEGEEEEGGI